jgi:hypothetical protein
VNTVERRLIRRPSRRLLATGAAVLAVAATLVVAAQALPGPASEPVAVTALSGDHSADALPPEPPALPEGIAPPADEAVPATATTATTGAVTATPATTKPAPPAATAAPVPLPAPAPVRRPSPPPPPCEDQPQPAGGPEPSCPTPCAETQSGTASCPAPCAEAQPYATQMYPTPVACPPPCGQTQPAPSGTTQVDQTSVWCEPPPECDAPSCCSKTPPCPPPPCPSAAPADEPCSPPCAQPADNGTVEPTFAPCPAGSGVEGSVHAGPTCPVERADDPCPDRPVETTLRLLRSDGSVAATGKSAADGTFRFAAPPGKYQLVADYGSGGGPGGCAPVDVVIEDGRYTTADVSCDTGIR